MKIENFSFICMKWGKKYGAVYVNKLFNGVKRNFKKEFTFHCITDDFTGLDSEIKTISLNCDFKGWMKKSYLFSQEISLHLGKMVCFIDLDMIIYNDITFLSDYDGDFCLMSTNDIKCEGSKDGYNSSIILWRNGIGSKIYDFLVTYHKYLCKQVIRFDHYLEFMIKNSDFVQTEFPKLVLDYNTYCKDKEELPSDGAIIAFPRNPKPHECKETWISKYWI